MNFIKNKKRFKIINIFKKYVNKIYVKNNKIIYLTYFKNLYTKLTNDNYKFLHLFIKIYN